MESKEIKQRVKKLLEDAEVTKAPISINKITKYLGIVLKSAPLENDISGFLFRDNKNIIVAVNQLHPKTRQRFTAAHEIGHYWLKHDAKFFIDRAMINFRDPNSS